MGVHNRPIDIEKCVSFNFIQNGLYIIRGETVD